MTKKLLLLIGLFLFLIGYSKANTCTSNAGTFASWVAVTWTCSSAPVGGPPTCGDVINIAAGSYVYISADVDYSACGSPITLNVYGTLDFNTNGVQFKLPAGSTVFVGAGGSIKKSFAGGGSSTLISVGGSNVWTAGDGTVTGPTTLPIELISLTATQNQDKVFIKWVTATEINNDFFTIEKTKDGISYDFVAQVDGAGNSTSILNYSAIDNVPHQGLCYYRLKQTDYDERFWYSHLIAVDFKPYSDFNFNVYPNPSTGDEINLAITNTKNEDVLVVVTDVTGKESYSKILITEEEGESVFAFDLENKLAKGIYVITATSKQNIYSKKLIVK